MEIKKNDLEKMNDMIGKGATIAELAREFPYDYDDIYNAVGDTSFQGRKTYISNRLKRLEDATPENVTIIDEIREMVDSLYEDAKVNGRKLIEIGKII